MFTPAKGGDEALIFYPKMAMGKATNACLSSQYYAYPGSKSKSKGLSRRERSEAEAGCRG